MKKLIFILLITLASCTPDNSDAPRLENYFSVGMDYYNITQRFWNPEINSVVATTKEGAIMVISFNQKPNGSTRYYTKVPGDSLRSDECSFLVLFGNKVFSSQLQRKDEIYFESIIDIIEKGDYINLQAANVTLISDGTQYILNTNFNVKIQ